MRLITRNRIRRKHNHIRRLNLDIFMRPRHHPIQYRIHFPLRPRTHHRHLIIRQLHDVFHLHNHVFRHLDYPRPERHLDVINHRKPSKRHASPAFRRFIQNQLNPFNLARETTHNHPPIRIVVHHSPNILTNIVLRMWMPPRTINIRRLIQHERNPLFFHNLIQTFVIRLRPQRLLFMPPVTTQIHHPIRRPYHNPDVSRN